MNEHLLRFWGKTVAPGLESAARLFKPALHHLLDVAAVALELQAAAPLRLAREAAAFGVNPDALRRARAVLAGLHDLGKISAPFQAKVPALWPADILGTLPAVPDQVHWRISARLLAQESFLKELRVLLPDLQEAAFDEVIGAVAGHHGRPPDYDDFRPLTPRGRRDLHPRCVEAAQTAVQLLIRIVAPPPLETHGTLAWAKRFSWSLSGLVTLADWVGSDLVHFPAADPEIPLDSYWRGAQAHARQAIEAKGLSPAEVAPAAGLAQVFPAIVHSARPMQTAADGIVLPDGPALFIVEDATGSGKTEAALALASRLLSGGRAEGVYMALPTMATADAMFARLRDAHLRLFAEGARPSVVLAHGRSSLSQPFAEVRQASRAAAAEGESVAASCAAWIADQRRRAFFAEVGAGTIDQAFLAVLPKKWLTLRQYGLAGRVLVVDEAHAFDTYMSEELATLLRIHAAAGGSAIVLSATLPRNKRARIAGAFAEGLGACAPALSQDAYPLLTSVSASAAIERPVDAARFSVRSVAVERLPEAASAVEAARTAAAAGAAVLWVRNAVDEAIAAAGALRAEGVPAELFHARFAMVDRLAIEAGVLRRFGRDASREERSGRILVATQVVEQSLDLDFDLVISDLAPVDLVIQRAGRLWRHMDRRPAEMRAVAGPRILVLSPDPDAADGPQWLEPALGLGAFVYRHPGVMWRSATALFGAGRIDTPAGLRPLIERVYGAEDVPAALEAAQLNALGAEAGSETLARLNVIDPDGGYMSVGIVSADQEVGTRLGEPVRTLRLARLVDGVVRPWAEDPDPQRAWALSEVTLREKLIARRNAPPELSSAIETARADWPDWDRTIVAVVDGSETIQLFGQSDRTRLTYSRELGLLWR
jgi:CRISPR-associated endonuclease/helicase Cas3